MSLPLLLAALASALPACPPQATLIDVNATVPALPAASAPSDFATLGGSLLFAADEPGLGRELFIFDGTTAQLLVDLYPGDVGSAPEGLVTIGSHVWFSAEGEGVGRELWRTDGTAAGTELVADLAPGGWWSEPSNFKAFGFGVLFEASIPASFPASGAGVWRSDGTAAGTFPLYTFGDWIVGSPDRPAELTIVGDLGFFRSYYGAGLWRTDGTPEGTYKVTGSSLNWVLFVVALGSHVYFTAASQSPPYAIWRSDGSSVELAYAPASGEAFGAAHLAVFAGELYYSGVAPDGSFALFKLDGSTGAPVFLADPDPGGNGKPFDLTAAASYLAFTVLSDNNLGRELWRSDGTPAGTHLIQDAVPGPGDLAPEELTVLGDRIVFRGTGPEGSEPWVTDGVQVQLLADLLAAGSSEPGQFYADGSTVWFAADDASVGREVFRTDGTPAGTQLAADAQPDPLSGDSNPAELVRMGTAAFFVADDGLHGRELWVTDGSEEGTQLVFDLFPGPSGSNPTDLTVHGERLYFTATESDSDPLDRIEVWSTDGTMGGTSRLSDLFSQGFFDPEGLRSVGGHLFFTALDLGSIGREPWASDGSPEGTFLLGNLNPDILSKDSKAGGFTAVGDQVVFSALGPSLVPELWRTDGTAAGTSMVGSVPGGEAFTTPNWMRSLDDHRAVLTADGAESGIEPWVTDGTPAGTFRLADIKPGLGSSLSSSTSSFTGFAMVDGRALFRAKSELLGAELWITDGTPDGTSVAVDLTPGPTGTEFNFIGVVGGRALLRVADANKHDLWASDGTAAGTVQLLDTAALAVGFGVQYATPLAGDVRYVTVDIGSGKSGIWRTDGTLEGTAGVYAIEWPLVLKDLTPVGSGRELALVGKGPEGFEVWGSRGTPSTTKLVVDVNPGPASSGPAKFTRVGDRVLFAGTQPDTGRELYSMPLAQFGGWVLEPYGVACEGTGGLAPRIGTSGKAQLGQSVDLRVTDAFGPSTAFLFLSFDSAQKPLGDCIQYPVDPLFLFAITGTDVSGVGSVTVPLPAGLTALTNVPIHFQYAVVDPSGGFGGAVALTDALEVIVGPAD
ncbi:ELWxxDGT repeat protein [Engelhardtia mirabilis]|uniref:ELWxxDGT repeat protein n=1 Tax=Engelhardtia mirabilis TaxID=2528011 RepID=A0A518BDE4_9BACT|nr:hypothetical protein Pla133_00840 [Planctomycetes bacterium Pla133]QDU99347.1 hypothetical protein Pla86_00840 [Planctomycetes bacterium Pla86]